MRKDLQEPLKKLAVIKGHLSSAMRAMGDVAEMVGKTPLEEGSELTQPLGYENVGEVMFSLMTLSIPLSRKVEDTTNYLRKLEGLKPNDYSKSPSTLFLNEFISKCDEMAEELGMERRDGGSPV